VVAYDIILHKGTIGEIYNFQSSTELTNNELCDLVIKTCGKENPSQWKEYVVDRAFNDQRYHVDGKKLFDLGWSKKINFEEGLKETVKWYRENDIEMIWGKNTLKMALEAHPSLKLSDRFDENKI